jgi:secreted trypsin-like serine protease
MVSRVEEGGHIRRRAAVSVLLAVAFAAMGSARAEASLDLPSEPPQAKKIIGGTVDNYRSTKWVTALVKTFRDGTRDEICTASLVAKRYVLTAAHCVAGEKRRKLHVRVGSKRWNRGGKARKIKKIFRYPNYRGQPSFYGDMAVLKLRRKVPYRPVTLVSSGTHYVTDPPTTAAYIAGWGGTVNRDGPYPHKLHSTLVWLLPDRYCADSSYVPSVSICAGAQGRDTCAGDSGGPLAVWDGAWWQLVGVTSYGPKRCASAASVYAWVGSPILHRWLTGS